VVVALRARLAEDVRVVPSGEISARNPTASSRIIPENDAGRTVVGFDANEVMRDLDVNRAMREMDGQRILRDSHVRSMRDYFQQHQKMLRSMGSIDRMVRSVGGIDQMLRSIRGTDRIQPSILSSLQRGPVALLRPAGVHSAGVYPPLLASIRETFRASHTLPESMLRELPGLAGNHGVLSHYARMQSDMMKQPKMLGYLGLSRSIAQVFKSQGLDSTYSAAWSLRRVQSFRTPALQSILKATTTFGPILVTPDEEDAPFDYHPDLQGWLIPETGTESEDVIDVEELWAEVVAFAVGIAQHHHTEVLLSAIGNGHRFLIRVSKHPTIASAIGSGAGTAIGIEIGGDVGTIIGSITAPFIAYWLMRR
jgi:hypothetical protein